MQENLTAVVRGKVTRVIVDRQVMETKKVRNNNNRMMEIEGIRDKVNSGNDMPRDKETTEADKATVAEGVIQVTEETEAVSEELSAMMVAETQEIE